MNDLRCIHVWGLDVGAFTWGVMISVHSCVRGRIPLHLPEGWWFQCIHVWGVGYRCIYIRDDDLRCIRRGRISVLYLRDDDVGAFCVRGRMLVHFPKGWRFAVHSSVRGKIPVHLLEGWWFRCIHVWGVWFRCIYLGRDDFSAFIWDW